MTRLSCEGWWVQEYFGRQPMQQLMMNFESGRISGTGFDIVGLFTFDGLMENGCVSLSKQYTGRHTVNYLGSYDGEGTMHGTWEAGSLRGPWVIRIDHRPSNSTDKDHIVEWNPRGPGCS